MRSRTARVRGFTESLRTLGATPRGSGGRTLRIAGYGGIDPISRPNFDEKEPAIGFAVGRDTTLLDHGTAARVDLLLTHQGTTDARKGSDQLNALLELLQPRLHLHGHSHHHLGPVRIGETESYSVARMPPEKRPALNSGHLGLLRVEADGSLRFENLGAVRA